MKIETSQIYTCCHQPKGHNFLSLIQLQPVTGEFQFTHFRRAKFTSSALLQAVCGKQLQRHALQLASKANLTREIPELEE